MSCPCGKCHCEICGNPMTEVDPDSRDELIEVYEIALKETMGWLMRVFENPDHDLVRYIKNTLAQGAEIKKLFKQGE